MKIFRKNRETSEEKKKKEIKAIIFFVYYFKLILYFNSLSFYNIYIFLTNFNFLSNVYDQILENYFPLVFSLLDIFCMMIVFGNHKGGEFAAILLFVTPKQLLCILLLPLKS